MANLAIVGTHSTNGVAEIHSGCCGRTVVPDLAELFPERFNNKTNGVTPRRWLLLANPDLARLITDAIGDGWVTDLGQLEQARCRWPTTPRSASGFRQAKRAAKVALRRLAQQPRPGNRSTRTRSSTARSSASTNTSGSCSTCCTSSSCTIACATIPKLDVPPRTFFFAGKAAPAYHAGQADHQADQQRRRRHRRRSGGQRQARRSCSCPTTTSRLAERLIPASDVSEQISTAGYEASGTSNMKFMMNGALTVGTRDGATIEMAQEAGEENFFLFGLTAEQVADSRGWYNPHWHYEHEPETRGALDLIASNALQPRRAGHLRADPGHPADPRRSLHAPGRPDGLRRRPRNRSASLYLRPGRLDATRRS